MNKAALFKSTSTDLSSTPLFGVHFKQNLSNGSCITASSKSYNENTPQKAKTNQQNQHKQEQQRKREGSRKREADARAEFSKCRDIIKPCESKAAARIETVSLPA